MGKDVLQITRVILHRSKPGQTFLIDIDPQWIDRCHSHIDSQVKFVPIYQVWFLDVLLDHAWSLSGTSGNLIKVRDHFNAFSLTRRLRLHNPQLTPFLLHLYLE